MNRLKVFITGNSSGLGHALSKVYLADNAAVYGLSRRGCTGLDGDLHDIICDLADLDSIKPALDNLFADTEQLDLVYLNAGVLGEMIKLADITLAHLQKVMNINVWANKIILDHLFAQNIRINQVIAISTGTKSANVGWASYSLSKVALNKLVELYANEYPDTHFSSLAPGLVDTAMQDYLCDPERVSIEEFPNVRKFRDARGTETMPSAATKAAAIARLAPRLLQLPSGSYTDMRSL